MTFVHQLLITFSSPAYPRGFLGARASTDLERQRENLARFNTIGLADLLVNVTVAG